MGGRSDDGGGEEDDNTKLVRRQMLERVDQADRKLFNVTGAHLMECVKEEIALEGLDGINFQALKIRLEQRADVGIEDFEVVAPAIWNQLKCCTNLKFYLLPKPRPDLVKYGWDDFRDERGNVYEPLHAPEDIYPYYPVVDKQLRVRGSCQYYHERKDISSIVRKSNYVQIMHGLGNRLVIVANQRMREQALLGPSFRIYQNLTIVQYCIMERIGRARSVGEVTRGKISLGCLKIQPKTQFYMRKHLLKCGLIKRQSTTIKFCKGHFPSSVSVFHLPRFYKLIESVADRNIRTIFSWLNNSPTKSIPIETITRKFSKYTLRNLTALFPTLVETTWEQRAVSEENSDLKEGQNPTTVKVRSFKVLRLTVTDTSVQNQLISKELDRQLHGREESSTSPRGDEADDQAAVQEENEETVNIASASSYSDIKILRPACQIVTSCDFLRVCHCIMRSGFGGLTQLDVSNLMSLSPLESRACVRFLTRKNVCKEGVVKLHRNKAFTYTLASFNRKDFQTNIKLQEKLMMAGEEKDRILKLVEEKKRKTMTKLIARMNLRKERRKQGSKDSDAQSTTTTDIYGSQPEFAVINSEDDAEEELSQVLKNTEEEVLIDGECLPSSISPPPSNDAVISTCTSVPDSTNKPVLVENSVLLAELAQFSDDDAAIGTCNQSHSEAVAMGICYASTSTEENYIRMEHSVPEEETTEAHVREDMNEESSEEGKDARKKEDSVDECIRKNMTRQRVAWAPYEDRLMLYAFIGSSLFIPKYTFDRVFMFNSAQIRDLLLKKSNKKSNKTSAAIRRRIHFLLRQKVHYDWYIQLLSEAIRDDALYEDFIKEHMPPPQPRLYLLPPYEALENVVDFLLKKFTAKSSMETSVAETSFADTDSLTARVTLTGVDTLLFLRQLKRSEFYWNGLLFLIFCQMEMDTQEARKNFYSEWKSLVKTCNENSTSSDLPVFEIEEVKEMQMELSSNEESGRISPQDMFLDYCWKFMKFITKNCNIIFNKILMQGSMPDKGFHVITFSNRLNSGRATSICTSLRECDSFADVRMWTARSLILEQIFSGGNHLVNEFVTTCWKEKLPMEKAARSLKRGRILVQPKGTNILRLNRAHLKPFVGGLPSYSFDEIRDLLRHLDEESSRVDVLACESAGLLMCLVELTDYWSTQITVTRDIFTLKKNYWGRMFSEEESEEEGDIVLAPAPPATPVTMSAVKANSQKDTDHISLPTSKKRKRQHNQKSDMESDSDAPRKSGRVRRSKRRKKSKEDKLVNKIAESLSDLTVRGESNKSMKIKSSQKRTREERNVPKVKVGLEEGDVFLSSSSNQKTLQLLRIRVQLNALMSSNLEDDDSNTNQEESDQDQDVNINFPNLEFDFRKNTCELNRNIVGSSHPFSFDALKSLRRTLVEVVYHQMSATEKRIKVPNLEQYLKKYSVLFDMISLGGLVGVSGTFLETLFERKSLEKGLRYLLEAKLIFSVGIVHRRYVSFKNVKDWVVPIRPKTSSSSHAVIGHVIMRPWITAVGGLSWTTISRLFTAMVGQLQKPSLELNELCKLFSPTLSPVESLVLIEALAKLKFLVLYRIQEPRVPSFWKQPGNAPCDIEYETDTLIDTDNVYVAVSPYITTLHAQLQHAIRMTSKTN